MCKVEGVPGCSYSHSGGIIQLHLWRVCTWICTHRMWMDVCCWLIGFLGSYFLAQFVLVFDRQQYIPWTVLAHPASYVENICSPWRPPTPWMRGTLITQLKGLSQYDIQK